MTNNITQSVIASKILPKIENEGLRYLIIPDILNAIQKDYSTKEGFINMIKSLMEEGITSLDSFNVRTNKIYNPAVKCGLITAITTESFFGEYDARQQRWVGGVRQNWRKIGLLSRFIPFSYEYTIGKTMKIFEFIYNEDYQNQKMPKQTIIRRMKSVKGNPELFSKLSMLSTNLGNEVSGYGIRAQKALQTLAKANAVLNGKTEVTKEDIDKILNLGNWMNYRFNSL